MHKMTIYPFLFLLLFFQSSLVCGIENQGCGSWTSKSPMPTARDHLAIGVVNGKIYAIGGRIHGNYGKNLNVNEMYNTTTDKWENKSPLPTKRSGVAASVVGSEIYVFGGEQRAGPFNTNEKYDPVTDSWYECTPMPTSRHGLSAVTVKENIYVIGGGPKPGLSFSNVNEVFTPQ